MGIRGLFGFVALVLSLAAPLASRAAELPVSTDSSTASNGELSPSAGKAKLLTVQAGRTGLLRFDLSSLSTTYEAGSLKSARLKVFVSKVSTPGTVLVSAVTSAWTETTDGAGPTVGAAIDSVSGSSLPTKGFIVFDVTDQVRDWFETPSSNFGFALTTTTGKMTFTAKEGPTTGQVAELELESHSVVSWGRVTATGGLDGSTSRSNVDSVEHISTGVYRITLTHALQSGFSLMAVVTPEIDSTLPTPDAVPPTGAANVRIAAVDMISAGTSFNVYMYNGSFALVDNDFVFILTGQ